jgi:hypothetical protein
VQTGKEFLPTPEHFIYLHIIHVNQQDWLCSPVFVTLVPLCVCGGGGGGEEAREVLEEVSRDSESE